MSGCSSCDRAGSADRTTAAVAIDGRARDADAGDARVRFSLAVAPATKRPWLDEAKAARSEGHLDRAKRIATAHASASDPVERAVAEAFRRTKAPAEVTALVRDDAMSARVGEALRGAGVFHYAGHGVYAGREGWESALPLAGGGRMSVADVLSMSPAPRRVVLSGCDAAKSEGGAEGLGLAQAFVAAGADEVLAPVRPVPDDLAARLSALLPRDGSPLAAQLKRASLALRDEDPSRDWAAFRVLGR